MSTVAPDLDQSRSAVSGGARLKYAPSTIGGTRLVEQWVRPPLHMGKIYTDREWAISQLMSPTAGLLSGDVLEVDVAVETDAKVALISPAACRVHTMNSGHATIRQNYTVAAGAVLDVWPAPLILQRGSSLHQSTRLELAEGASALICEVLSPGRATFGEVFEFDEWRSRLRIYQAGALLAYENFSVMPPRGDVKDWREQYPSGSYAGLYYLSPKPLETLVQDIHDLGVEAASIGASPLRAGGVGIKVLARDGISLRKAVFAVRLRLIEHSGIEFPVALKRAQTFFH